VTSVHSLQIDGALWNTSIEGVYGCHSLRLRSILLLEVLKPSLQTLGDAVATKEE
jgi:hypothetical protein